MLPPATPPATPVTAAAPVPAAARLPVAPTACNVATILLAATPPPLAMAADDIIDAAHEPAAIPAEPNPRAGARRGAAAIAIALPATTAPTAIAAPIAIDAPL